MSRYVTPEAPPRIGTATVSLLAHEAMSLITAHRILIIAAIVMFTLYGAVELRGYLKSGEGFAVFRAGLSFLAVIGWALYLRTVGRRS